MMNEADDGPTRAVVCLVGMHRSGTSLCANVLQALGVDMAEGAGASPDNARGHWERACVNDLNDQVFALFARGWASASHALALPLHWREDPRVQNIGQALLDFVAPRVAASCAAGVTWGVKDPRIARLLPLWRQVFLGANVAPRFVICVRDPAQVARSLHVRDHFTREHAEYRWLIYNTDAVAGIGPDPVCVIPYEHWFERPLETAARLATWAGVAAPQPEALSAIIDASLRHDGQDEQRARPLARRLHRLFLRSATLGHFDPDLRNLSACIGEFEQQVQPLLVETEILRASVSDQNRVIGDLNHEIRRLRQNVHALVP
jgi:hypothetical protein